MKKMFYRKEATLFAFIGVISLAILVYGYQSSANLGAITVHVPYANTAVFWNNEEVRLTTATDQEVVVGRVAPGEQSVLVYKEGYYPWEKTMYMREGEKADIFPFLVRENPGQHEVDPAIFANVIPPNGKKVSASGAIAVDNANGKIYAIRLTDDKSTLFCGYEHETETCYETVVVLDIQQTINNVDFYPDRDDVILFSTKDGLYAIEIDGRGTRNFQPIYEGSTDGFLVNKRTSSIYVKNGQSSFQVLP